MSRLPSAEEPLPVIVIFAPTACGKTALAGHLFGRHGVSRFKGMGEVVSADSQAVYRGLDIGTAKPSRAEQEEIPCHLLDVVDPQVQFGVGEFLAAADAACRDIVGRGRIPLVVGGTGFYVRAFLLGLPGTPEGDPAVRAWLQERLVREGLPALYAELSRVDPASAARIGRNDAYRILRALEVQRVSGRPLSSFSLPGQPRPGFDFCTVVLTRARQDLYRRIDERIDAMFAAGLRQEVARLRAAGCTASTPAMKAIGYREFFVPGKTEAWVRAQIAHDSHRYAKKQCLYLRGIPGAVTVDAGETGADERVLSAVTPFCLRHWPQAGS